MNQTVCVLDVADVSIRDIIEVESESECCQIQSFFHRSEILTDSKI